MTLYLIANEAQQSYFLAVNAWREHTLIVFTSNGSTDGQNQILDIFAGGYRQPLERHRGI